MKKNRIQDPLDGLALDFMYVSNALACLPLLLYPTTVLRLLTAQQELETPHQPLTDRLGKRMVARGKIGPFLNLT